MTEICKNCGHEMVPFENLLKQKRKILIEGNFYLQNEIMEIQKRRSKMDIT